MARVTTIFTMSLVAVAALTSGSGSGDLMNRDLSVEENETGLDGLFNLEDPVDKSPYQQQPDGTSSADVPASITSAPAAVLQNLRQLPPPPPAPGGKQPLPEPDTSNSAASALASLSAKSSSDVARASAEASAAVAAQASSQIAFISASLAASASSAIAAIQATAAPGQLPAATVTVTQTVEPIAAPNQPLPTTITVTRTQTLNPNTITTPMPMKTAQPKPDLMLEPTASNALISDPNRDFHQVDLSEGEFAGVLIGTIIGTALATMLSTLLFVSYRRQKRGQVYVNGPDDTGSQTALRTTYVANEKERFAASADQQRTAVTDSSLPRSASPAPTTLTKIIPSQRTSLYDERPPVSGGDANGFNFGPFRWSNAIRNSIFGSKRGSQHVEVRTAHKRSISSGSRPRLIRLGSRDGNDKLTPVSEGSREAASARTAAAAGAQAPSRGVSASPLNLNPPNAPFRNAPGDAVSWGSWGSSVFPDTQPDAAGHIALLLKEPPRHQHSDSSGSNGSSSVKILDASQNKVAAAAAAKGSLDVPQPAHRHDRRPSSGVLGAMGGAPPTAGAYYSSSSSSRLDGPPEMPHSLPPSAQYPQQPLPTRDSYWSTTVSTPSTSIVSPISSIGALKSFSNYQQQHHHQQQPLPQNPRYSTNHQRVQSMTSSRYSMAMPTPTGGGPGDAGGLQRPLSGDSSHRRSASVNSILLTSSTVHTNGATFSLYPAPAPAPPLPTRSYSAASTHPYNNQAPATTPTTTTTKTRRPSAPRAISAVAPPPPAPPSTAGLSSPPPLPTGRTPKGFDMV